MAIKKSEHIHKCQIEGCAEPANVYLISVPNKSGHYCSSHAHKIWSEYYEKWKATKPATTTNED